MEYLLILNTFRIPRSSLDIQDGIYEKTAKIIEVFTGFKFRTRITKRQL
jgi:hypothetical protein